MKLKSGAKIVFASLLLLGSVSAHADTYPSRTISMVVPFPAGGPSDVIARIVAGHMSETLGQTIIIENVGGAGGTLGSARVAAATPDGYTLLAGSMGSHVAAPALFANLRYDSARDFVPIGLTAIAPVAIVARKDFPAKDMRGFIDYLRANGEKVKQAHGGIGSSSHMACLLFTAQFHLNPKLVPYRGTGPAVNDLAGGHVDYLCEQVVSVAPQVTGGLIKAYGVTGTDARREYAERADHGRNRISAIRNEHLERPVGAQGNAEGRGRQALRRPRQGAGRSGRAKEDV